MESQRSTLAALVFALASLGTAVTGCESESSPVPGGPCVVQRDCVVGEQCVSSVCRPTNQTAPCTPGQCGVDQFCDVADGRCKPLASQPRDDAGSTPDDAETVGVDAGSAPDAIVDAGPQTCTEDTECGTPPVDVCVANQCVKGCGEPEGLLCTGGTRCDLATGKCRADPCADDADCGPPQRICEQDICVSGCVVDISRCEVGAEVCDTDTGRCVPLPTPCIDDTDCAPPMTVCEALQCVPGCGQPGGVQCSGTSLCDQMTGRCGPPPPCAVDADCMRADLVCVEQRCTLRCDQGGACGANELCDSASGRCLPANLPLGEDCLFDVQCDSDLCLTINPSMTSQRICVLPCSATSQCPLDFTCGELSEMPFCLSENLFTPAAQYDTRSGGSCSRTSNTCQSSWCDPDANVCLEQCARDSDCAGFGSQCWVFEHRDSTNTPAFANLCVLLGGAGAGAACTSNAACRSGICNRLTGRCSRLCCRDQDCGPTENCVMYTLDASNLAKICAPRGPTTGTGALGTSCLINTDCETSLCQPVDASQPSGPTQCTSRCCTNADCTFLGSTAHCRPVPGPIANSVTGVCFSN